LSIEAGGRSASAKIGKVYRRWRISFFARRANGIRKFKTAFMRGGTIKELMFHRKDLPDQSEWDPIFLQAMGEYEHN
jgi:hypothetical protein